jgi:hypothetical protein
VAVLLRNLISCTRESLDVISSRRKRQAVGHAHIYLQATLGMYIIAWVSIALYVRHLMVRRAMEIVLRPILSCSYVNLAVLQVATQRPSEILRLELIPSCLRGSMNNAHRSRCPHIVLISQ